MNESGIIEGEAVEVQPLAVQQSSQAVVWTPSFAIAVDDMVARVEAKHDFFKRVMRADDHYGAIPGAGKKQVLLKPGAELLLASMGLFAELSDAEEPLRDYGDDKREGLISYRRRCRIYRQTGPTEHERMLVAQAEGFCTSRETKYRYRNDKLKCPACGKPTIIKAKDFSGQGRDLGWVCWKKEGKSDGCAEAFPPGDPSISSQVVGKIPNPDIADSENTILKMADKRALVAATLIATGCSDIFTQDVEEEPPPFYEDPPAPQDTKPTKAREPKAQEQPPPSPAAPEKISEEAQAELRKLVIENSIPINKLSDIVKTVQKHFGFEETGSMSDLHKGDEATSVRKRLKAYAEETAK